MNNAMTTAIEFLNTVLAQGGNTMLVAIKGDGTYEHITPKMQINLNLVAAEYGLIASLKVHSFEGLIDGVEFEHWDQVVARLVQEILESNQTDGFVGTTYFNSDIEEDCDVEARIAVVEASIFKDFVPAPIEEQPEPVAEEVPLVINTLDRAFQSLTEKEVVLVMETIPVVNLDIASDIMAQNGLMGQVRMVEGSAILAIFIDPKLNDMVAQLLNSDDAGAWCALNLMCGFNAAYLAQGFQKPEQPIEKELTVAEKVGVVGSVLDKITPEEEDAAWAESEGNVANVVADVAKSKECPSSCEGCPNIDECAAGGPQC